MLHHEKKKSEFSHLDINDEDDPSPLPISIDEFNSCFEQLMSGQSESNLKLLDIIYKGSKLEISIMQPQLEFLLQLSLVGNIDEVEESLSIIERYSSTDDTNWFLSILPPSFFPTMFQLIQENKKAGYAFSILHNCLIPPNRNLFDMFTETEIMPIILNYSHKYYALLLYQELLFLDFKFNTHIYEKYLDQIIQAIIEDFKMRDYDDDFIYLLRKIAEINPSCAQVIISNPEFLNLFSPENFHSRSLSISLMKFIVSICDQINISSHFIDTNVMKLFLTSIEKCQQIKSEKKRNKIISLFLKFFNYLSQTDEGKMCILENNIYELIFAFTNDAQYKHINRALQILCQIGLSNITEVILDLIQKGVLNMIALHLTDLKRNTVLDCLDFLLCVEGKVQTQEISVDFTESDELLDALLALKESHKTEIAEKATLILDALD